MMQKLIRLSILLLVAASVWLVMTARSLMVALERATETLPSTLDRAVAREAEATRQMVSRLVTERGNAIDAQLSALRRDMRMMEADLAGRAERQLNLIREDLQVEIASLNRVLMNESATLSASATNLMQQYGGLSAPLSKTLDQIRETADLALDCDHNPDCFYNRYVGTMRGVEKTSVAVAKMAESVQQVTPETAKAVQHTSRDMAIIVNRFARPTHWLKSVLYTAARSVGKWFGF